MGVGIVSVAMGTLRSQLSSFSKGGSHLGCSKSWSFCDHAQGRGTEGDLRVRMEGLLMGATSDSNPMCWLNRPIRLNYAIQFRNQFHLSCRACFSPTKIRRGSPPSIIMEISGGLQPILKQKREIKIGSWQ